MEAEADVGGTITHQTNILVKSMCSFLTTKIKCCFLHARKNKKLAESQNLRNLMNLIGEQLLPQWCKANIKNEEAVDQMHNLIYLLAQKVHAVFFTRVIHTIID